MRVVYVANKQMITVDFKTKSFMKTLSLINKDAIPDAAAMTLNFTADQVTKQQIRNVKNDFTIRTPFTLRSMESGRAKPFKALNKASGNKLQRMFSRAGTFSRYLWMQEENHEVEGINGPIPIATKNARTSKSEKKSIAKRFRISRNAKLRPGSFGDSGKQFIGRIAGKMGLWQKMKRGLRLLRNLDHDRAKIKGTHFHKKAVKRKGNNQLIAQRFKKYGQKEINKVVRLHG